MIEAKLEDVAVAGDGSYFLMLISTDSGDMVPIMIGPLEAHSIVTGRSSESFPRPLTHDLILSIVEMLDASIKRVEITDLNEDTYYAKLVLENRGIEFEIDARPSDALALVVRTKVPLFVDQTVIDKAAMTSDFGGSGGVEA